MGPKTLEDWQEYIGSLSGATLRSKALAANSVQFVRVLEGEGYSAADITAILRMFAQQFEHEGQEPPSRVEGTYLDYGLLLNPVGLEVVIDEA